MDDAKPHITEGFHAMKKVIGVTDVISFGISATIGSGVFVTVGYISKNYYTGPSLFICFGYVILAVLLSALCFSEFASKLHTSGMGYSYANTTYGKMTAFCIGVITFISYCLGTAAVSRGFADYLKSFIFASTGYTLPPILVSLQVHEWVSISLLAPILCATATFVAMMGVQNSARVAHALMFMNISIMVGFIIYGLLRYGDSSNLTPLTIPSQGWGGLFKGSGLAFFCVIGWEMTCSLTEEMKNPVWDLPIGIITTLGLVGLLYCTASITLC